MPADDLELLVKVHLHELPEPGAVVVPRGLGVAERLQHGVGVQDLLLDGPGLGTVAVAEVPQKVLGGLGFSGPRFAGDDDGLGLFEDTHVPKGFIGDCEDVGRFFPQGATLVAADCGRGVEFRDLFVGVDGYEDVCHVCLEKGVFVLFVMGC